MRGIPTMTTSDWLHRTLSELRTMTPGTYEHDAWTRAARTYASIIAGSLTETRTADEVLADAINAMHMERAA